MENGGLIFRGAEAEVRHASFLGVASVRKERVAKTYRLPELDARVRRERTRLEALVLAEAAASGVEVPRVVDVDVARATLELEYVEGPPLREVLDSGDPGGPELVRAFGHAVGKLHSAGLIHGDLTTSNALVRDGRIVLVDFGLAQRSAELEDQGVDLHLVERTFEASHPGHREHQESFLAGYRETFPQHVAALRRRDEIKDRARYA